MDSSERLLFRSSLVVLLQWTLTFFGIIGAIVYGISWAQGRPTSGPETIGGALTIGLLFGVAVALFPVYVLHHGVRCYNFWGAYRTIAWSEVSDVQRQNLFGLRYLSVASIAGGSPIWIPLYLSDMTGFITAVKNRAGRANPLVVALETSRV